MEVLLVQLQLGKDTGFPLVKCPWCKSARVIELVAKTDLNFGRIFFKCPSNIEYVSSRTILQIFQALN